MLQPYLDNLRRRLETRTANQLSASGWRRWEAWFGASSVMANDWWQPTERAEEASRFAEHPISSAYVQFVLSNMEPIGQLLRAFPSTLVRDQLARGNPGATDQFFVFDEDP